MRRYESVKTKKSPNGKTVYETVKIPYIEPTESDIYVISTVGDRLDYLANSYYGNPRYWWVLAMVNNLGKGTMIVEPGTQLRIPNNPSTIIQQLQDING